MMQTRVEFQNRHVLLQPAVELEPVIPGCANCGGVNSGDCLICRGRP